MLEINNISKIYRKGNVTFTALENVTLTIDKGEYIAVKGSSGAGKSTLLNAIGGLIRPDSGEIKFNGNDIFRQRGRASGEYRKMHIGFMFQQFHLMPYLTVLENIKLAVYNNTHFGDINGYLVKCSLEALKNKYPDELSVGEKQRAAFIRAIISDPEILLADEPTGNLDPENSRILMQLVDGFHQKGGTVIIVSHDPVTAKYAGRSILIEKGRLIS